MGYSRGVFKPLMRKRLAIPGVLAFGACSAPTMVTDAGTDAGLDAGMRDAGYDAGVADAGTTDAGPCPHASPGTPMYSTYEDDAGLRCVCEINVGSGNFAECCDPDIGNPCPICCLNLTYPDGGREYYPDGGPQCLC
jgi:hypothetical protein